MQNGLNVNNKKHLESLWTPDAFSYKSNSYLDFTTISKMKHQSLICIHDYVVNGGMPEGWVKLKLKGIKFGDGEKETAHNIRLSESAITLFLYRTVVR